MKRLTVLDDRTEQRQDLPTVAEVRRPSGGYGPHARARDEREVVFAALRHRNYRIWTVSSFISTTGLWMQVLGVNWYVLQSTGSATRMGFAIVLQTLPVLLLGPWAGALADRMPARPLLITTQVLHASLAAGLAAVAWSPWAGLTAVYVISIISGVVSSIEGPAMGRFNSTIVDRSDLGNALALGSLVNSAARILGMSLGGVLVAAAGPAPLFALNAVSFVAVVIALVVLRERDLHALDAPDGQRSRGAVRDGFAYLLRQPVVLVSLGLSLILGSLGRNYQVTMAAMSDGPLGSGAAGYGLLSTIFAVGTVLGALAAARHRDLGYRTLVGAGLLASLLQILAGFAPGLWIFTGYILPIAAAAVLIDTTVSTRVQLDTREDMRGRVLAALGLTGSVASMAGAPLLGWLAETVGARETFVLAGAVTAIACTTVGIVLLRLHGRPVRPIELRLTLRATVGLRSRALVAPQQAPHAGHAAGPDRPRGGRPSPRPGPAYESRHRRFGRARWSLGGRGRWPLAARRRAAAD